MVSRYSDRERFHEHPMVVIFKDVLLPLAAIGISILALIRSCSAETAATSSASATDAQFVSATKTESQLTISNGSRHSLTDVYVFSGWSWMDYAGRNVKLFRWHPDDIPPCTSVMINVRALPSSSGVEGEPNPTSGNMAYLFWSDVGGTTWERNDQDSPTRTHGTKELDDFSSSHLHEKLLDGSDRAASIVFTGGACGGA